MHFIYVKIQLKITIHTKRTERMTSNQMKPNNDMEANPDITQMLELLE